MGRNAAREPIIRWVMPASITYIGGKTGNYGEWDHESLFFYHRNTPYAIVLYTRGNFAPGNQLGCRWAACSVSIARELHGLSPLASALLLRQHFHFDVPHFERCRRGRWSGLQPDVASGSRGKFAPQRVVKRRNGGDRQSGHGHRRADHENQRNESGSDDSNHSQQQHGGQSTDFECPRSHDNNMRPVSGMTTLMWLHKRSSFVVSLFAEEARPFSLRESRWAGRTGRGNA